MPHQQDKAGKAVRQANGFQCLNYKTHLFIEGETDSPQPLQLQLREGGIDPISFAQEHDEFF